LLLLPAYLLPSKNKNAMNLSSCSSTTPLFPQNGPDTEATFDGHILLLMTVSCPPELLEKHVSLLGKEFEPPSTILNSELDVAWPIAAGSALGKAISRDALLEWNYDLFKLREVSGGHPLVYMAHGIIQLFDLVNKLKLDEKVLHRCVIFAHVAGLFS
jgi:hypothetical protein